MGEAGETRTRKTTRRKMRRRTKEVGGEEGEGGGEGEAMTFRFSCGVCEDKDNLIKHGGRSITYIHFYNTIFIMPSLSYRTIIPML